MSYFVGTARFSLSKNCVILGRSSFVLYAYMAIAVAWHFRRIPPRFKGETIKQSANLIVQYVYGPIAYLDIRDELCFQ